MVGNGGRIALVAGSYPFSATLSEAGIMDLVLKGPSADRATFVAFDGTINEKLEVIQGHALSKDD